MAKFGAQTRDSIKENKNRDGEGIPFLKEICPVYIHPFKQEGAIFNTGAHYLPIIKTSDVKGRKVKEIGKISHICLEETSKGCPLCDLLRYLNRSGEYDGDDVVLEVGEGRLKTGYTVDQILGKTNDFRSSLKASINTVITYIDHDNPEDGQKRFIGPKSIVDKIDDEITDMMEEFPDDPDKADVLFGTGDYALKLTYNANAKNKSDIYKARALKEKKADSKIRKQLKKPIEDPTEYTKKPDRNGMLEYMWDHFDNELLEAAGIDEPSDNEEEVKTSKKSKSKVNSSKKSRHLRKDDIDEIDDIEEIMDEDENEDEDDEEETKPSRRKSSSKSKSSSSRKSSRRIKEEDEDEDSDEDEDDEDETKPPRRRSKRNRVSSRKSSKRIKDEDDDEDEEEEEIRPSRRKSSSKSKSSVKKKRDGDIVECPHCFVDLDEEEIEEDECPACGGDLTELDDD